jgi:NADH-quinone oxidoreductase E subunit
MKIGLFNMQTVDLSKTDKILAAHQGKTGSLIPILQEVQAAYGYVPEAAMRRVAETLKIPASKVYGVVTFYAQFHLKPRGRNVMRICCGTACHVQGGEQILSEIKDTLDLHSENTTSDGKFTLEEVACLGCCGLAPVLMLNDDVHAKLTKEKLAEIINNVE